MIRTLILVWRVPLQCRWYPIGGLTWDGRIYRFAYTGGALDAHRAESFAPLPAFPDFHRVYQSDKIFPLFANRLMPSSRPDYPAFLRWLDVPKSAANPMVILERSGGRRVTDSLEIPPYPDNVHDDGLNSVFFLHAPSDVAASPTARAEQLRAGEQLLATPEFTNREDPNALALRIKDTGHRVGYCPRFLSGEIRTLMASGDNPASVTVERVNVHPAPARFRVLCRLQMNWPPGYRPFSGPEYQPIVSAEQPEMQVA